MPESSPLIAYPVDYEFKVIGRAGNDFEAFVRTRVGCALGRTIEDREVEVLPSREGRFASVRVCVRLENEAQRLAVYAALSNQPRIVFYL